MCFICDRIKMINNGTNPYFVKELQTGYVVIGDNQHFKGYTLFLCKEHKTELFQLNHSKKIKFLEEMSIVAEAVSNAFGAEKMNYELLGNGDTHLHWHLFPRKSGDIENYGNNGKGPVWWYPMEKMYNDNNRPSKTELEDLYICVKENKPLHIENIIYLMKYFKNINIVTPNIKEFQRVADKIEENENIIITVTNNKKKSLKKAKVIVNFDLQENEINKYIIYREAVILTIDEKGFYESNTFNGIQIRRIGIDASNEIKDFFEQYNLLDDNELSALYESRINQKQGLSQIKQQMKKDEIKVTKLYGKNGSL